MESREKIKENHELSVQTWKFWTQRRYILAILVFFAYVNIYSLRVNLSLAIVDMTKDRYDILPNGTEINTGPEFSWDNKIQGYLLSSFFYGYITTQILGGYLSKKFGGKVIFGGGIAGAAIFTLLGPLFATLNVYLFLVSRIITGIFEGVTYSSLFSLWAKWIPLNERSRIATQANSGSYAGAVFSMMFYAYLINISGWRSTFYFSGGMALVWCILWYLLMEESPDTDKRISESELKYIQQSLEASSKSNKFSVPWKYVLVSKPVCALLVAIFCESWGFFTLLTLLPKYFKDVFDFDISKSGILSALPYLFLAVMMQVTGQLADRIVQKKLLSITWTRKAFVIFGFLSQTSFMLGAAFWGEEAGTVFCLVTAVGMGSFAIVIMSVNALDIAPSNASVLIGYANSGGTLSGIISPIIAGYIISTENPTVEEWRIVFYISASFYLFGAVFFFIFASGVRQSWDIETKEETNGATSTDNSKIPSLDNSK